MLMTWKNVNHGFSPCIVYKKMNLAVLIFFISFSGHICLDFSGGKSYRAMSSTVHESEGGRGNSIGSSKNRAWFYRAW